MCVFLLHFFIISVCNIHFSCIFIQLCLCVCGCILSAPRVLGLELQFDLTTPVVSFSPLPLLGRICAGWSILLYAGPQVFVSFLWRCNSSLIIDFNKAPRNCNLQNCVGGRVGRDRETEWLSLHKLNEKKESEWERQWSWGERAEREKKEKSLFPRYCNYRAGLKIKTGFCTQLIWSG